MKNRSMKKGLLSLAILSVMAIGAFSGCSSQQTSSSSADSSTKSTPAADSGESALLKSIKEKGFILIGSSNDAPFSYEDIDTKELAGIDIEILKEICNRLGIPEIKMKVTDFSNLLVELNNKNIDLVADAMYVRDDRLEIALFTDKWYTEGEALVIQESSDITSADQLADKTVGAQPGTAFYELADKWLDEGRIGKLEAYESQATLMTALNLGKVDAVVTDGIVAGYTLASDSSLKLKLLTPYTPEASGEIGAAVRFEDKAFLEEINTVLNEMKEDGKLMEILKTYGLSEDYFVGVEEGKTTNIK